MASGAIPQNQLDALPIQTYAQAAEGGNVNVIGGSIVRTFTPEVLGINGSNTQLQNTKVYLATPWLDLSGCKYIHASLMRTHTGVGIATPAVLFTAQIRQGPTDTPSVCNVSPINDGANGIFNLTSGVTMPAIAAGEIQRFVWSVGPTFGTGLGYDLFVAIGPNIRFIWSWSTNAVAVTNFFTAYITASS